MYPSLNHALARNIPFNWIDCFSPVGSSLADSMPPAHFQPALYVGTASLSHKIHFEALDTPVKLCRVISQAGWVYLMHFAR